MAGAGEPRGTRECCSLVPTVLRPSSPRAGGQTPHRDRRSVESESTTNPDGRVGLSLYIKSKKQVHIKFIEKGKFVIPNGNLT